MKKQIFKVPAEFAGKRLDIFLTSALKLTRNQVKKMITSGLVEINKKAPSVHHWLKEGERIIVKEKIAAKKVFLEEPEINIAAETDDYAVILKPVGLLVHPAAGNGAPSLTDALIKRYPSIVSVGDASRPGLVHRLDKDVGGLLVAAKTQKMYDELQRQFKERLVKKIYTALVEGVVPQPDGVLDFVLARSKTYPGRMAARPKGQDGRSAETRFTVLQRFPHHTLLELKLVTGRTHQIRAHLKAFGHPIVGDTLYGLKKKNVKKPIGDLGRPFLQATALGFFDLKGQWQEFTSPLEGELQNFLNTLS